MERFPTAEFKSPTKFSDAPRRKEDDVIGDAGRLLCCMYHIHFGFG